MNFGIFVGTTRLDRVHPFTTFGRACVTVGRTIHFNKYDFLDETLSKGKINNKTNIKSSSDAEYHLKYLKWCTRAHRFRCRDEIICVRRAIKNTYLTVMTKRRLTCAVPRLNRFVLVTI